MRIALRIVAGLSGLALACRAFFGPFSWMHSPINAESIFALAMLTLVISTSEGGLSIMGTPGQTGEGPSSFAPEKDWRADWLPPLGLIAVIAAAFAASSRDYFLSDDFIMLQHAHAPFSWWMYSHGGGDGFFRPLIYESFRFLLPWAGESPFRWHLSGLAIHAANSILVLQLARALGLGRPAAWFAGALFAIHASRPETAVWITGRYDLISTFFVLLALVLFLNDWRWFALIAMVAGLLCKESAYACPLLLLLLAPRRLRALIPFFAAAAALFLYRFYLFGSIGGYKTAAGAPQALSIGFVAIVKALALRLWAVLFFPLNWSFGPPGSIFLGVALLAYICALLRLSRGKGARRQMVTVSILFILVAALPPVQQLLIGADLQKARYLYMPSVGFCLLAAALVRRRNPAIATLILAFQTVALFHNLEAWHEAAAEAKSFCAAVAEGRMDRTAVPTNVPGVYLFQNGLTECIEMAAKQNRSSR